ncbi:cullin-1, putative [Entamoeba invadens IP1]|uniref:Cullin-1, putative n=1 Tax=Entamoeba invadens IP1 TaxID=370355 RepID=L7FMB4_ENTIV|nr:cullin-1, putative [Entamoeba invadens IP1]ELP88618.1 cullin-1, putative [Entamoeba invadens IP1]|eukprot:XP_004255389.1 cullin-1, putative [Entamoeba invadens IP1]
MEHIFITNTVDEVLANYKTVFYSKSNLALSCIQMCFLTNEIVTKQFLDKTEELFLKKCTDHINEALTTNLDILNNSDAISNLLLKLYESMEDLIVNGFLSDWRFKKVLNETLKNILMNNELLNLVGDDYGKYDLFPKCLGKYTNTVLLTSDFDSLVKQSKEIADIVSMIHNEDAFLLCYTDLLKERIVMKKSKELYERKMVEYLKEGISGIETKFNGLFSATQNREIQNSYEEFCDTHETEKPKVQLEVTLFEKTREVPEVYEIPKSLAVAFDFYTKFYTEKFETKKIMFQYTCSQCVVLFKPKQSPSKKEYIMTTTFDQMLILFLFNTESKLKIKEIAERVDLSLERTAIALSGLIKQHVMRKNVNFKDLEENCDVILYKKFDGEKRTFNTQEPHEKLKVAIELKKKSEEDKMLEDERAQVIQARLVVIMKFKRVLKFSQLIAETTQALINKFPKIQIAFVKKQIEKLIIEGYMKRSEDDPSTLEYVA